MRKWKVRSRAQHSIHYRHAIDRNISPKDAEAPSTSEANPPHRVLFVRNLPLGVTEEVLGPLFQQYPGFQEVRTVPGKADIAFVEYETDGQAETAKRGLDGFKMTETSPLIVEFAKKG